MLLLIFRNIVFVWTEGPTAVPLNESELRFLGLNESDQNIFVDLNSSQKYTEKLKVMHAAAKSTSNSSMFCFLERVFIIAATLSIKH